ncbi:MAG: hypothetical protein E7350_01310 [Clostridiales bacterium]|nr:hypothetical protein [Clostridiales bacterium]
MKDNDFHKLIEQQNAEKKAEKYAEFEKKHDLPKANTVKAKQKHTIRYSLLASVLAALCLVVALIVWLIGDLLPRSNNVDTPTSISYYVAEDCTIINMDNTVKDYAASQGLPLLYIDWYDEAEDIQSWLYVDKNDNTDIVYIRECIANSETGNIVNLYIIDMNTNVDIFTAYKESCNKVTVIGKITVNWAYSQSLGMAFFVYEGYKYYISLDFPMAEDDILRIAEGMIIK